MPASAVAWPLHLAGLHLPAPVWWFYALGPQLALCLCFGYWAAKRRRAEPLVWLTGAFLAALVPVAGVVVMIWLWWRSPQGVARQA